MLSWLKGDKVDHPLGSTRELKRVVDALPGKDPLRTLEEVASWLESVNDTDVFKLDQRFNVIESLDEASRKAQERARLAYNTLPDNEHVQEKRIWKVATDFWNALAAAYLMCVRLAQDAKNVPAAFKPRLPLVAARAAHALRNQMHWVLVRYGALRASFWSEMGQCARLVETEGAAALRLALYGDAPLQTSQRIEHLRAMMFWAASPSGLSPIEQDFAERLVAHLAPRFRMGDQPWEGCDYCFDLDAGWPPLRYGAGIPKSAAPVISTAAMLGARCTRWWRQAARTRRRPTSIGGPPRMARQSSARLTMSA
ncbi:MAG: hypothetical protein FJY56_14780 [Betaproteobacteria bacterium]|nr:hypothetical protein [Betaproteobacteria bacterium]